MKEILIVVPAHNEEQNIRRCLYTLSSLTVPEDCMVKIAVVLDRCTDRTAAIVKSMPSRFWVASFEKTVYGPCVSHGSNNFEFALKQTCFGDYIVRCDADVQNIPSNALELLLPHLNDEVRRVSGECKSRTDKWYWNLLFWLAELNARITPLGEEPRGAVCMFERRTVQEIGGFHRSSWSWDTGFDVLIKQHGWKVMKVKELVVTSKRKTSLKGIIRRQILSGKARRSLNASFKRTLLHSIFRGRIFVLYGYLTETYSEFTNIREVGPT